MSFPEWGDTDFMPAYRLSSLWLARRPSSHVLRLCTKRTWRSAKPIRHHGQDLRLTSHFEIGRYIFKIEITNLDTCTLDHYNFHCVNLLHS